MSAKRTITRAELRRCMALLPPPWRYLDRTWHIAAYPFIAPSVAFGIPSANAAPLLIDACGEYVFRKEIGDDGMWRWVFDGEVVD